MKLKLKIKKKYCLRNYLYARLFTQSMNVDKIISPPYRFSIQYSVILFGKVENNRKNIIKIKESNQHGLNVKHSLPVFDRR